MKSLLRRRLRLWVLMSITFSLIMIIVVTAIVMTFDLRLEASYQNELSGLLSTALERLEKEQFNAVALSSLEDQGIRILVLDEQTGELCYRPEGRTPLSSQGQFDSLIRLVQNQLGSSDGSFMIMDSGWADEQEEELLESKELFLCGRSGSRIFCLNVSMVSTNTAVKLATRFTRRVGLGAGLLSVFLFYYLSKLICRPHRRIAETAAQIAKLDFSKRCPENITREMNDLRQSINAMADSLEVHVNALREANSQLQTELAERIRQQQISADLIANLAHDLKTPIAIISGYAEGLEEGLARTPEKQQSYYEAIEREGEHMQAIVTRILALGRMESGETPITLEQFDLTDLLDEILDSFQREMERRKLILTRVGTKPCMVYTDYECARQSLINYIQNAVYHINNGDRIEVRLEDLGDRIRVRVLNSSAPIPDEVSRRLWEKLYRGDPSRQRQHGEMGLGLSIVKGNMERLGHAYGFENDPDFPGACFWLELPKAGNGE